MRKRIIKFIPAISSFLVALGIGMLMPIKMWLAYSFIGLGILLLIIPGWSNIRRFYLKFCNILKQYIAATKIIIIKHKIPHFASYSASTNRTVKDKLQVEVEQLKTRIEQLENPN